MKTSKKLICFLCCLVVLFTCASVSWSPHADAAAPIASYVASVVGSFILSAGFSFDNRGDFQSATEAFLESDIARGITEITDHVGRICALGNLSEPLLIHELINAGFFKDFWNSIYDFFGRGDITIETEGLPAPPSGYAYYNNFLFPIIPSSYTYQIICYDSYTGICVYCFSPYDNSKFKISISNSTASPTKLGIYLNSIQYTRYVLSSDGTQWTYNNSSSSGKSIGRYYFTDLENAQSKTNSMFLYWSSVDFLLSDTTDIIFPCSTPIIEGTENVDVIGVYNNEVHSAEDIISSWARAAENGGAIDWALDSIPAYQDITSNDKDVPVTQTQTGVLTQSGVKVQTDEEVKEEVKQEAIKELGNYTVTGLASIFPFCIPFDIYNFFAVLTAEREAPVFDFPLNFGKLGSHNIHVDLSGWNTVAQILRTIELLAFCVALAWGTSKLIKW